MAAGGPAGERAPADLQHPGHRRHHQDGGARHRARRVDARRGQPRQAPAGAGQPHHGRPAVRRLRRLFRHQRQPGARCGGRPAGAPRRHARSCRRSPEIYGGEHLLTRRAVSQAVADKLLARLRWWEDYCARNDGQMDNNPSAGNKAGGLTTILEKSLGAIAKSGTTNLVDVVRVRRAASPRKGLVFMDTPGYDPVSATGQVAGGANLICFTTGRGSAYGCAPSPVAEARRPTPRCGASRRKTSTSTAASIIDGSDSIDTVGERIFRLMLATASGQQDQERAARLRAERVRALAARRGDVAQSARRRLRFGVAAQTPGLTAEACDHRIEPEVERGIPVRALEVRRGGRQCRAVCGDVARRSPARPPTGPSRSPRSRRGRRRPGSSRQRETGVPRPRDRARCPGSSRSPRR